VSAGDDAGKSPASPHVQFGMSERGIHYVEADLDETWWRDWIGVGIAELEAYLERQSAFLDFLRARDRQRS
jgi:hypothetical protein